MADLMRVFELVGQTIHYRNSHDARIIFAGPEGAGRVMDVRVITTAYSCAKWEIER